MSRVDDLLRTGEIIQPVHLRVDGLIHKTPLSIINSFTETEAQGWPSAWQPIHFASDGNDPERQRINIVKELIALRADVNQPTKNAKRNTPVSLAVGQGTTDTAILLARNGAYVDCKNASMKGLVQLGFGCSRTTAQAMEDFEAPDTYSHVSGRTIEVMVCKICQCLSMVWTIFL